MHLNLPGLAPMRAGNKLTLLVDEAGFIPDMQRSIAAAERTVDLSAFSLQPTGSGAALTDAIEAVGELRNNIVARVGYDAIGSSTLVNGIAHKGNLGDRIGAWRAASAAQEAMAGRLRAVGADVREFPRMTLRGGIETIDHRKILVVDDHTAYIGGANFADRYGTWHDVMVKVEGPAAADVARDFQRGWVEAGGAPREIVEPAARGSAEAQILTNVPPRLDATGALFAAMTQVRERLWVQSPMVTDDRVLDLLVAARRGAAPYQGSVDTLAMVNRLDGGKTGAPVEEVVGMFNRVFAGELAREGVTTLQQSRFSHQKVYLLDDEAWVGSMNATTRALRHDEEIVVRSSDPQFVGQVERLFADDRRVAAPVTLDEVDGPVVSRLSELRRRLNLGY